MHKMPNGTMMKGAKHGYNKGGMACGASNPASRPVKGFSCGGYAHKKK